MTEALGREPIRVVLGTDFVKLAKRYATKDGALIRELACLAGSVYFWGGSSGYYLARVLPKAHYDMAGMNVFFYGVECNEKEKIWSLELMVPESERRRGFLYFGVAVSSVVKKGDDEKVACLICGYIEETSSLKRGPIRIPFIQTTAPMKFYHQGETDSAQEVKWPDDKFIRPWASSKKRKPVR